MRRGFSCMLIVLVTSLILAACTIQLTNKLVESVEVTETTETESDTIAEKVEETENKIDVKGENDSETVQNHSVGFPGEDIENSELYSEADGKQEITESDETKQSNEGVETPISEESEDIEPSETITYGIDLVEPPAVSSAIDF